MSKTVFEGELHIQNEDARQIVTDYIPEVKDANLEELRRIVSNFDSIQSEMAIDILVRKHPDIVCDAISKHLSRLQAYREAIITLSGEEV